MREVNRWKNLISYNKFYGILNKIEIYGITISMCAAFFVNISINSSYAQSMDNFKTYTNNVMNFTIQYPSNWEVKENTESLPETVSFTLPDRSLPIFLIRVEKVERYIDADTNTLKNTSLEQYVQQKLDEISSVFTNFNLIRKNDVTVGGNAGWKIEWTGEGSLHLFEIITIANGKLYTLLYQDGRLKVPETLPIVNKIVESFRINTENTDSSNGLTFEDYEKKYCPEYSDETQLLVLCSPSELEESDDVPVPPED